MKMKIRKAIIGLGIVAAICLAPFPANAGWISQAYYCQVGQFLGIPVFRWVTICDAWGGSCSTQYCCEAYYTPPQQ